MSAQLIDLPAVKAAADFEHILAHYGVALLGTGDQRRALCPFHTETKPSFKVNVRRKLFHCFGCDRHGNVLDFVMQKEEAKEPRAATRIAEICGFALPTKNGADDHATKRVKRPVDTRKDLETGRSTPRPETCTSAAYTRDDTVSDSKTEMPDAAVINPVLTFTLKLEPDHPYLGKRGISAELVATFGLGLATRGSMRGRIAIPIHNERGELVAYAGRWPGDELPQGVEKYLLPAKFKKTHVLYNLHRVAGRKHVIVVEGYFGVIRLHALGVPAVALMGRTIAAEQVELLGAAGVKAVTVMLDGDAPGRTAIPELLPLLARRLFVRVAELPDGLEPDTAAAEIVRELVGSRS